MALPSKGRSEVPRSKSLWRETDGTLNSVGDKSLHSRAPLRVQETFTPCRDCLGCALSTLCPTTSTPSLLFCWEHFLNKSVARESSSEKLTFSTPGPETSGPQLRSSPHSSALCLTQQVDNCIRLAANQPNSR